MQEWCWSWDTPLDLSAFEWRSTFEKATKSTWISFSASDLHATKASSKVIGQCYPDYKQTTNGNQNVASTNILCLAYSFGIICTNKVYLPEYWTIPLSGPPLISSATLLQPISVNLRVDITVYKRLGWNVTHGKWTVLLKQSPSHLTGVI